MPDRDLHPGQLGAKTPLHPVRVAKLLKLARLCCTLSRDFARFKFATLQNQTDCGKVFLTLCTVRSRIYSSYLNTLGID